MTSADIDTAPMAIAGITAGRMARKVIVTVGRVDGADLDKYVSITAKGGTCVITAMGSVVETAVTLNLLSGGTAQRAFGFGRHFCLGNQLARLELSMMNQRLLHRLPGMPLASDERRQRAGEDASRLHTAAGGGRELEMTVE